MSVMGTESPTYDRTIRMYDEPHPPEVLAAHVAQKTINQGKFLSGAHAGSYLRQMQTIHRLPDVQSCFEVGPGEGFVARNLRALGYRYDTLDFEPAHQPTFLGDFKTFDVEPLRKQYDLSGAFQVLEHFPFEHFPHLLRKLAVLSKKYVFISLPFSCEGYRIEITEHQGQHDSFRDNIERFQATGLPNRTYRKEFMEEFPWAVHYWEIGRAGYDLERITDTIRQCGLEVIDQFHGPNPFHYFMLTRIVG